MFVSFAKLNDIADRNWIESDRPIRIVEFVFSSLTADISLRRRVTDEFLRLLILRATYGRWSIVRSTKRKKKPTIEFSTNGSRNGGCSRNWNVLSRESNEISSYRNRTFARPLGRPLRVSARRDRRRDRRRGKGRRRKAGPVIGQVTDSVFLRVLEWTIKENSRYRNFSRSRTYLDLFLRFSISLYGNVSNARYSSCQKKKKKKVIRFVSLEEIR